MEFVFRSKRRICRRGTAVSRGGERRRERKREEEGEIRKLFGSATLSAFYRTGRDMALISRGCVRQSSRVIAQWPRGELPLEPDFNSPANE